MTHSFFSQCVGTVAPRAYNLGFWSLIGVSGRSPLSGYTSLLSQYLIKPFENANKYVHGTAC